MIRTRSLFAAAAATSLATASGAQILLALDFQGIVDPAGLSGVDPVTQAGFDAFEVSNITAVPDPTPSVNPSFTNIGGVTFSITGTVGGFGTAGTGTDDLDRDFMFLGNALGYDDLVSWDVTGLPPTPSTSSLGSRGRKTVPTISRPLRPVQLPAMSRPTSLTSSCC